MSSPDFFSCDALINVNLQGKIFLDDAAFSEYREERNYESIPSYSFSEADELWGFGENEDFRATVKEIRPNHAYDLMRQRDKTVQTMRKLSDSISVLYECPCHTDKKILHHPSYENPLEVMKLCRKCHAYFHKVMRQH